METNMNCEEARNRIYYLVEGALDPEEAKAVETHLETCEACRSEYSRVESFEKMWTSQIVNEPVPKLNLSPGKIWDQWQSEQPLAAKQSELPLDVNTLKLFFEWIGAILTFQSSDLQLAAHRDATVDDYILTKEVGSYTLTLTLKVFDLVARKCGLDISLSSTDTGIGADDVRIDLYNSNDEKLYSAFLNYGEGYIGDLSLESYRIDFVETAEQKNEKIICSVALRFTAQSSNGE